MAYERSWQAVNATFISDGTTRGTFQVSSPQGFYVKQLVSLSSNTQPPAQYQIKRIDPDGTIYVGAVDKPIGDRQPIPQFLVADAAKVVANEQPIPTIKPEDIWNALYERDPIKALRTVAVDPDGNIYGRANPMPVSSGGLPGYDDVKVVRDVNGVAIQYQFYYQSVLKYYIAVSYDINGNAIDYQTTVT